jgi:hypothetical protein
MVSGEEQRSFQLRGGFIKQNENFEKSQENFKNK